MTHQHNRKMFEVYQGRLEALLMIKATLKRNGALSSLAEFSGDVGLGRAEEVGSVCRALDDNGLVSVCVRNQEFLGFWAHLEFVPHCLKLLMSTMGKLMS